MTPRAHAPKRRDRAKVTLALAIGFAACVAFVWITNFGQTFGLRSSVPVPPTEIRQSQAERSPAIKSEVEPNPTAKAFSMSPELLSGLQKARLKDVKRSAAEDSRVLANVLSLTPEQQALLNDRLIQSRFPPTPPQGTEQAAVTQLLNSEQIRLYTEYLEHRRRADAERSASVRLHSVEGVTGPLSGPQKDAIFANFLARDVDEQVISDQEILKSILNERQYELWSKSVFAAPEEISEGN